MPRLRRKLLKLRPFIRSVLYIGLAVVMLFIVFKMLIPLYKFTKQNNLTAQVLLSAVLGKEPPLKKNNGRTNIVILGISGSDHEGGDLTDTIIFMSVDFADKDVLMVSVPRDLWLPTLKTKVNAAYHYGQQKRQGGGLILAKSSISEVIGQPVSYGFVINFSGFKKMIDLLGGIDINVEQDFEDRQFPISGKENDLCDGDPEFTCRFELISFKKGLEHMDGERTLKYVRSRNAPNGEGTDFSRSKRQQQVIFAMMTKMKHYMTFNNFAKLKPMIPLVNEAVDTDLKLSEQILLGRYFLNIGDDNIRHIVLDTGDPQKGRIGLLVNPPVWQYDGLWVLAPSSGDFGQIQKYIQCQIQKKDCPILPD